MPEVNKVKSMSTALEGVDRLPKTVQSALNLSALGFEDGAIPVYMEGILTKGEFLEQMRFEKRRVDRSQAPLSMALFVIGDELLRDAKKLRGFLVNLKRGTRETDIKGWVNSRTLGLLLPDTDGPGAERCVALLNNGPPHQACAVVTGTYPDQLFQGVLEQTEDQSKIFTLDLEESGGARSAYLALKRLLDLLGAISGLVLFSPLMLVTALAVKLTSPGPIIFQQTRLGKRGSHFSFYKFRSMEAGNDDRVHREYVCKLINGENDRINQGEKDRPLYKLKNDCRITKVGRIIRKLSIDELPQLFNVLKGEMSLVGPRPPIPYEVEKYKSWHLRRILEVKPGITGLWQVDGRSKTSFDEMVRLDIRYVQNRSLWLDIKILFRTVREVLIPKGGL
jgi:lipopolysaccharide/colanic/teichoic acid biosynthesis glycosyltransferase